ncbi:hypothetical protein NQ317_002128 [Molorchus minor]|uniref:Uncharacterized protein n=1 Tax=Molorchus minor TaxID=1323400 RepID=A0ABQ9JUC6_9CUCU|nr:hypothetical protein NQ317_002128 [Molorchus minor]
MEKSFIKADSDNLPTVDTDMEQLKKIHIGTKFFGQQQNYNANKKICQRSTLYELLQSKVFYTFTVIRVSKLDNTACAIKWCNADKRFLSPSHYKEGKQHVRFDVTNKREI